MNGGRKPTRGKGRKPNKPRRRKHPHFKCYKGTGVNRKDTEKVTEKDTEKDTERDTEQPKSASRASELVEVQ